MRAHRWSWQSVIACGHNRAIGGRCPGRGTVRWCASTSGRSRRPRIGRAGQRRNRLRARHAAIDDLHTPPCDEGAGDARPSKAAASSREADTAAIARCTQQCSDLADLASSNDLACLLGIHIERDRGERAPRSVAAVRALFDFGARCEHRHALHQHERELPVVAPKSDHDVDAIARLDQARDRADLIDWHRYCAPPSPNTRRKRRHFVAFKL